MHFLYLFSLQIFALFGTKKHAEIGVFLAVIAHNNKSQIYIKKNHAVLSESMAIIDFFFAFLFQQKTQYVTALLSPTHVNMQISAPATS